ncbi:hypothetical protein ACWDBW_46830 [Streptomyces sp. NPDC001107]
MAARAAGVPADRAVTTSGRALGFSTRWRAIPLRAPHPRFAIVVSVR